MNILDTHVLVTKDGHEEYMAKTSWDNTTPGKEGDRDGYFLVASTPPEVEQMKQIKEVASKSAIKESVEQEIIDPVLVEEAQPVKQAKPVTKKGK